MIARDRRIILSDAGTGGSCKIIMLAFMVVLQMSGVTNAQETSGGRDSTKLYADIESFSSRSKFTLFIHRLIFKSTEPVSIKPPIQKKAYDNRIQKPYSTFEGKTIRRINIITIDPFMYAANDTIPISPNFLEKAGNATHIVTKIRTIRNLLLFQENQAFNSLLVRESERLIRDRKYVQEVSFSVVMIKGDIDSVDIVIREIDKWSIIPSGSVSSKRLNTSLKEMNFLGLGHEFDNTFSRDFIKPLNAFKLNYYVPNIRETYINAKLHYALDGNRNFNRSLVLDRPFYSSVTKWAGGAAFYNQQIIDSIQDPYAGYIPVTYKHNSQDYWASKAFRVYRQKVKDAYTTNIILTLRFLRRKHLETLSESPNPLSIRLREYFYLSGIGISNREYVQDRNIFKFGVVEDVPIGRAFGLTFGYQVRNKTGRYYAGLKVSNGNHYPWGYFTSNLEFGGFIHASKMEQGVLAARLYYFTDLFELGRWRVRQFAKPEVTIGINRLAGDSLTLNDGSGLNGFNSFGLVGTNRILLTFQTQAYAPWTLIGFHFGPYLIYSLGMLGDAEHRFKKSSVYSQIGVGVMIKNMNLVFNTFQISLSFYPNIPGIGRDIFKMNSFATTDIGFSDYVIGKPAPFVYQ